MSMTKSFHARTVAAVLAACAAVFAMNGAVAGAAPAPGPGWTIRALAQPSAFSAGDGPSDHFLLIATNVGAGETSEPTIVRDQVPDGLEVTEVRGQEMEHGGALTCSIATPVVECELPGGLGSGDALEVTIYVNAVGSPGPLEDDQAVVEGGGAEPARGVASSSIGEAPPFGVENFGFDPVTAAGAPDQQAGDHPYALGAGFDLTSVYSAGAAEHVVPTEYPKNALVYLPPGVVGNPTTLGQCPLATVEIVLGAACPADSRVGRVIINTEGVLGSTLQSENTLTSAVYNVTPEKGYPAEFAFIYWGKVATMYASLVHIGGPGGGYRLRVGTPGIPVLTGISRVIGAWFEFWGTPGEHNSSGFHPPSPAFLTMGSDCAGVADTARVEVDSWEKPAQWVTQEVPALQGLAGCEALQFAPQIAVTPSVTSADSPSGYEVDLHVPQAPTASPAVATPDLKNVELTFPSGVALSPAAADGLVGCKGTGSSGINLGSAEIGPGGQDLGDPEATELGAGHPGGNGSAYDDGLYHTAAGHCPQASQIGEVEFATPLLNESLKGHVYVASPRCGGSNSPCTNANAVDGSLYGIYIEAAGSGVIVKLQGKVSADPQTGQLTVTFAENPQLPVSEVRVRLKSGSRAPLTNPQTCGTYETTSDLTSWSTPETAAATPSSAFALTSGANGSGCVSSEAQMANKPSFEAGTTNPLAGQYSPFVLKVSREDGSQRLNSLNLSLPEGLLARLAGTPYCPDAVIAAASSKSGTAEKASPSCPAASEVGTVTVGAGPGSTPYYVQGHAYLAGPYKGAPLSLAIVTPAVAGPFDLGTVVVRTALYVDPTTARVTAKSDPFPTILDGTPLDVRSIALKLDKSQFTLNPTSCEEMSVSGEAVSTTGSVAPLKNRFQVGGCKGLDFAPKLALRVFGKTNRNAKPRFRAVLTAKPGEANIVRAQVNLPHSEFLEQNHLKQTCTRPVLLAGDCPASSVYGHAKAWTPLLEKPLEGNVYLVGGYGYKLPALVAELNGQIRVLLVGKVDSGKNKGIRNTFEVVPDAPVSKFMLELKGGRKGLLVNSEPLCAKTAKTRAIVRLSGQNGSVEAFKPKVQASCGKGKKKGRRKKGK